MASFRAATVQLAGGRQSAPVNGKKGLWGAGFALLFLLLAGGSVQADVRVTGVSFAARADGQGYVMRLRTTGRPEAYMLQSIDEHTLKWVVYNASLDEGYEGEGAKGPVKRYTTTQRNGHLVLRVALKPQFSVSATAYRDGASDDLLLNLAYDGAVPTTGASFSSSDSASEPTSESAPKAGQPAASGGLASIASMTRQRSKLDTIVIDPGHGGKDPGAVANGLMEKNIVLDVALKLGDYIENRLGIEVAYTRTKDRFIPLEERGHFANRVGGDLFISLHVNAYRSSAVNGTETYFLGRSKTDAARRVMRQENSVVQEYEKNPERYEEYDAEAFVKGELFLSASMQFSEELA
ncbi:MAG: N-acetylmuramoyl-L-alanine amidase, partial [Salinibacter sp.]